MDVHVRLDQVRDREESEVNPLKCQAIVGLLMSIALATRPDISYAVSALSRSTAHHRLHSGNSDSNRGIMITGYIDTDRANSADRKSQGRHVFILNKERN